MSQLVSTNDFASYADYFSKTEITGTRWLILRDVPELVQKYVNGITTLDYGCGPGMSTMYLKSLRLDVDGVDINNNMIKHALEKDPNGKYSLIKSGQIAAEDNHYDLVFTSLVLHFVSNKQELQKVIGEITRVLKKGGVFIAVVLSENAPKYEWYSFNTKFKENENLFSGCNISGMDNDTGIFYNGYYWMEKDYKEIFNNLGLTTLNIHRPLGTKSDGYIWISEKEKNVCDIYVVRKNV